MADSLDLPLSWNGSRVRVGGNRHRVRLSCDQLESRDATGSIVSGVVAAAFGGPLSDSLSELARLVGDWAFLDASLRTSQPASPIGPIADESPRKLARYDTWLEPALLFAEERPERRVRVTAPAAPADPGRGAVGDLLGGPPHLSGPAGYSSFPSFVGVRAAAVFTLESPQSPRSVVTGATAAFVGQDSETLPFGVRSVVNADEREAPIVNAPPHAVADSITVDEDESVVFDPTANDTDPDGDPLWVKSVQAETPNGRTYWEEGGNIRYIPNPDYENTSGHSGYDPDTFTYTVTDGLAEATATVTVTVDAVDDPVVAFHDAYYMAPTGAGPGYDEGLLRNDIDYDVGAGAEHGLLVDLASLDLSGVPAGVLLSVQEDGSFTIGYGGKSGDVRQRASFSYQATDGETLSSRATVHLWLDPLMEGPAPAPTVTAGADRYFVGDDILQTTDPVTKNDTNWEVAVLRSHPASGRVTAFSPDGHFEYMPSHTGGGSFEYAVLGSEGWNASGAKVEVSKVNLTIHHGQGGKAVSELNEQILIGGGGSINPLVPALFPTGAFTVANQNDSDADGQADVFDNDVPANPAFAGSGEKDLMKLVMSKPAPVPGKDTVTLSVSSSSAPGVPAVKFWKVPTKGNQPQALDVDGKTAIPVNAIPAELWVEMAGVSAAIGDVSITMEYAGATDTVNVTGIWTKHDQTKTHQWPDGYFMNTGTALPDDADAEGIRWFFDHRGKILGIAPNVPHEDKAGWFITRNNELSKFTVLPSGMTPFSVLGIVSFDATRSFERKGTVTFDPGGAKPQDKARPPWLDVANDESPVLNYDNDNDLLYSKDGSPVSTDNIYYWDSPGTPGWQPRDTGVFISATVRVTDVVVRDNYFDFVRVSFGKPWVPGQNAGVQGSRSSVYYAWSNMLHVREKGPPWILDRVKDPGTVTENQIEKGHININVAGGGVT